MTSIADTTGADANPSDLGRRIRDRRERLGLSLGALARRAGMAPGYLEYLECRPGAGPGVAAMTRLAAALDTTVPALRGGGLEQPPGSGRPSEARPLLEALDPETCLRLLGAGGIGRAVFDEEGRPVALPVNFVVRGEHVLVRTGEGALVAAARFAHRLSFEVDQFDEVLGEGWSILVTGAASVEDAHDASMRGEDSLPEPWAGGTRAELIRIALDQVSGRRIRQRN